MVIWRQSLKGNPMTLNDVLRRVNTGRTTSDDAEWLSGYIEVLHNRLVHAGADRESAPTFGQYQQQAVHTAQWKGSQSWRLCNWALGATGEAGEIAELVKKMVFHKHPITAYQFVSEIGDTLWYLAVLCEDLDLNLGKVAQENLAKLARRYPNGYTKEDSVAREDVEFANHLLEIRGGEQEATEVVDITEEVFASLDENFGTEPGNVCDVADFVVGEFTCPRLTATEWVGKWVTARHITLKEQKE